MKKRRNVEANQAETTITLTDAPDDGECAIITEGLRTYNEAQAGVSDSRALAILVRDPETQNVVGGLLGRTSLGLLRVDRFFLPEDLRRDGLGSRILAMAEKEARRRGCSRAGLGGRGPDRLRAAWPYPVLYDEEAALIHSGEAQHRDRQQPFAELLHNGH